MALTNTKISGRYDIIIFPNGGKECIGHIQSEPSVPESEYLPYIKQFVSEHQNLEVPTKYTSHYSVKNGKIVVNFGDWEGEIPQEEIDFNLEDTIPLE